LARKSTQSDINWIEFKDWLNHRYAKSHVHVTMSYCKRYNHIILGDIKEIDKISPGSKNHAIKALIVLSKYLGIHQKFKTSLKNYGVKLFSPDAFNTFMRVYTNKNSNINEWLKQASNVLRPNEQLYLEFMSLAGLRKEEGIISFNKIIELTRQLERVL
jgi:hypothetical protein